MLCPIQVNYGWNKSSRMDGAMPLRGMLSDLDPYTTFWTEQEVERVKTQLVESSTGREQTEYEQIKLIIPA
jgi:recombinational DNA repair protein RecT